MNPLLALIVAVAAVLLALLMAAWALMERARANRAEARAWEAAQRASDPAQADALRAQAAEQANVVARALIERTDETFRQREELAQRRIEAQLKPVAETLAKFQEQVTATEKARAEETGGLKQQISALLQASVETQAEARKLSSALRRGAGVQGRWGEQMLRNVLEMAGLQNRFDFEEQPSMESEEGRRRPDVKVRLPNGGVLVIDAKCSLNAFLEAQEATDEATRLAHLGRHAQSLRSHMTGLSGKAYWDQFRTERTPDMVIMFVPGDGYLAAALEHAPDLLTEAMERRVLIATPTSLFAVCKAVAYGWRVEDQAEGAAKIATLGKELYKRLSVMGAHAASVGKALDAAVSRYNQFVGSLETQVMTQARRFEELKVDHEGKEIPVLEPVELATRPLTKFEGGPAAEGPPVLTVAKG
jgi:DNA recombination protein RmuC